MNRVSCFSTTRGSIIATRCQEGKTSLFDQGHLSTAAPDVVQVYVRGDQGFFVGGPFYCNPPPGVDDMGVAQENEAFLLPDPVDEDHVAFEQAGVEAGDVPPIFPCVQQLGVRIGTAVGGDYEYLGPVLNRYKGQTRLPGIVTDQHGHPAEFGLEDPQALSRVVMFPLFVDS